MTVPGCEPEEGFLVDVIFEEGLVVFTKKSKKQFCDFSSSNWFINSRAINNEICSRSGLILMWL